jgi:outer membrane lipoprotein-sorting protein
LSSSVARAAYAVPAGAPLQGEERARVIERLQAQQREVTTLRATVIQKKRHPLLKGEVISEGTLLFSRPHRVRWEMTKPEHTIVAIDGHALLVYHPARKEAERRDLRGDLASRAAAEFLAAGMSLDVAELEKRFQVDVYREDGRLSLWLTPRSRFISQAIVSITIVQREDEALPRQIVIAGTKGDRTETSLTDVTLNPPLHEDAFAVRLAPDVRVVETHGPAGERGSGR